MIRSVFLSMLMLTVGLTGYIAAWLLVDVRNYIDVQEVRIHPTVQGELIRMETVRLIHKDFEGGYRVEIRSSNSSFCSTGNIYLRYKTDAVLTDPLYLNYWAAGGACVGKIPEKLKPGLHSVRTCHIVRNPLFILPSKDRCVGTVMEILPREPAI